MSTLKITQQTWGYNLQEIFEAEVQHSQIIGTFTSRPVLPACSHLRALAQAVMAAFHAMRSGVTCLSEKKTIKLHLAILSFW